MKSVWDLVVAGGGPAGYALAAKAANGGARVLLIEKEATPGAGRDWIVDVEKTVFEQADVPGPDENASWKEADRTILTSPLSGIQVPLLPPPTEPVRNGALVRQLAGWAVDEGAEVRMSCTALAPVLEQGAVTGVAYRDAEGDRTVKARIVADCTGVTGTLRRRTPGEWRLSPEVQPFDVVMARREVRSVDVESARMEAESGLLRDGVLIERLGVHGGYSVENVILDLEEGRIDILVGTRPRPGIPTPEESINGILARWPFIGEKIFGDGAPIPIRRTWDSLVGNGFLVLGDSACQVIPMHGSGTASAMIAADIASRAVIRALEEKRYDRPALWDYCHAFQSSRGALLAYYYAVRLHADTLSSRDVDEMVKRGVLAPEDIYSGLVPERFEPKAAVLARKVAKGIRVMPLLIAFARAGLRAEKVMRHYQRYPERYRRDELESWVAELQRLTRPLIERSKRAGA